MEINLVWYDKNVLFEVITPHQKGISHGISVFLGLILFEGPFSCPRANLRSPYQALGVSTQILAFWCFLCILFGRYIYYPLEGFIIITDPQQYPRNRYFVLSDWCSRKEEYCNMRYSGSVLKRRNDGEGLYRNKTKNGGYIISS